MSAWSYIVANWRTSIVGPVCAIAGIEHYVGLGPAWLPRIAGGVFIAGLCYGWIQAADAQTVARIAEALKSR